MKKRGRARKRARPTKTKKKALIQITIDPRKQVGDIFKKYQIENIDSDLKYEDGVYIFDTRNTHGKDMLYQTLSLYKQNKEEAIRYFSKRWKNFSEAYWSFQAFVGVDNAKISEENTYFSYMDIEESIYVCRKAGCGSRSILPEIIGTASGDEGIKARYTCLVCSHSWKN